MASFNDFKAHEYAVQIVVAAAQAGSLKLNGMPSSHSEATSAGKADGEYIAALIKSIASGIQS